MDAMSIDMDPSNSPVNTATSVGTREFCARINENDVLDADEDAADTLEFDVTTGANGIPEGNPMLAFTFDLRYNSYGVAVVGNDVEMLLKAKAGSAIFDLSQSLPDTDGEFTSTGADFGSGPLENVRFESGPGVLARMRIESRPDVISGIHHLILSNAVHINTLNSAYAPLALNHAVVAIGTECPETQPEPTFPPGPTFTPGATTPAKTSPQTPFTPPPKESPIKPTNTPTPTPPGTPTPPQPAASGIGGDSVTDTPTPAGLPSAGGEPRHARSVAVLSALALAIIGFAAAACWTALRAPKK